MVVEGCHFGCHPEDPEDWCYECRDRAEKGPLPVTTRRMRVVELPINASEDRVVGTIDLEAALKEGSRRFEPGVLAEANRNILYEQHAESEQDVRSHISEGIATFPEVDLPREILRLVAQISIALEVDGHRSDLVCARAAQAKAAYDSDDEVKVNHVSDVAEMVFAHRVHAVPFGKGGPNLSEVISRMIGQA